MTIFENKILQIKCSQIAQRILVRNLVQEFQQESFIMNPIMNFI